MASARVSLPNMADKPEPPPPPAPDASKPLSEQIIDALKSVFDPEIPVNIYELGLIYEIKLGAENTVAVKMSLTSPACPAAGSLPGQVQQRIKAVPGITACKVEVVWDPPWDQSRMSEAAKLQLGLM